MIENDHYIMSFFVTFRLIVSFQTRHKFETKRKISNYTAHQECFNSHLDAGFLTLQLEEVWFTISVLLSVFISLGVGKNEVKF